MSLLFADASTDKVDLGSGTPIDNVDPLTLLVWLWVTALPATDGYIWHKGSTSTNRQKMQVTSTGVIECLRDRATTDCSVRATLANFAAYGTGKWLFVAFVFANNTTDADNKIVVGDLTTPVAEPSSYLTQNAGAGAPSSNASDTGVIGNRLTSSSLAFRGRIAMVGLIKSVLTLDQIVALQFTRKWERSDMQGLWLLGENGTGTQPDRSGNGGNGTVTGATVSDFLPLGRRVMVGGWRGNFKVTGAITVAIGQVIETDTAQAISLRKTVVLGQVAETDLAQAVSVRKTVAVGQVTETDLAQAITRRKTVTLGQVAETDLAQALSIRKTLHLGQVSETDLAQPITVGTVQLVAITQVVETDTAQSVTIRKTRAIGQVTETNLAQAISVRKTVLIGQVVETDLAQAIVASGPVVVAIARFGAATLTTPGLRNATLTVPGLQEATFSTAGQRVATLVAAS